MIGLELIKYERERQIAKGWTVHHAKTHAPGSLARAAVVYALYPTGEAALDKMMVTLMPWSTHDDDDDGDDDEKETGAPNRYLTTIASMTPREKLAKAGALIAAELDQLP